MSIRHWFGSNKDYDKTTPAAISLDSFLEMYVDALKKYLNCTEEVSSILDLINTTNRTELEKIQVLFLEWLEEKGVSEMLKVLEHELSQSDLFVPHIEYHKYILEEEMDFVCPDSVRSCLVDTPFCLQHDFEEIKEHLGR